MSLATQISDADRYSSFNNDLLPGLLEKISLEHWVSDDGTDMYTIPAEADRMPFVVEVQNLNRIFHRKIFFVVRNECIDLQEFYKYK